MRVLYAWELGDNYGHLTRGVALGQSLRRARHPVMFAVRNTTIANEILAPAGFHFVQAPVHMRSRPFQQPISNYAGILLASGYDDLPGLSGMLRAWMSQISLFGADVVLIDHAPTALLAARALGIPALAVGTGFEIPPDIMPFPLFAVSGSEQGWDGLSDGEALRNINQCLGDIGKPELADLGGLFGYSANLITTIEELDHYPTRANALHIGPITGARNLVRVEWQTDKKIKALVYLRGQRSLLERVVAAVQRLGIEAVCIFPGQSFSNVSLPAGIQIVDGPIDVSHLLEQAGIAITNGSAGMSAECLLRGVPMVLLPLFDEQRLGTERVADLHAGIKVSPEASLREILSAIMDVTSNSSFRNAAMTVRAKYRTLDSRRSLATVLSNIDAVAGKVG